MIGIQEALDRLLETTGPVGATEVPLRKLAGRVAAEDLSAEDPVPDFRRAMMDGYAVRSSDVADAAPGEPVTLRVTGGVTAGSSPARGPGPGEAWEIATGAPLPAGADGVVPYEWTRGAGGRVAGDDGGGAGDAIEVRRALGSGAKGVNVAPPGEDIEAGTLVLEAGRPADARHVAGLAAAGAETVRVHRRPRVAVVSTGDELVPPGHPREEGQIHDSNGVTMAAAAGEAGAEIVHVGSAPDRVGALRAELERALEAVPDAVLTTGGVSVGARDRVPDAWRELGLEERFHGVAIKPGKPVLAGDLPGRGPGGRAVRVMGLSGAPPANAAAWTALVRPMLLRLAGRRGVMPPPVRIRVAEGYPKDADMTRLLWCVAGDRGEPFEGSLAPVLEHARLEGICRANAMVVMPAGTGPWPEGQVVRGFRLDRPATEPTFRYRPEEG